MKKTYGLLLVIIFFSACQSESGKRAALTTEHPAVQIAQSLDENPTEWKTAIDPSRTWIKFQGPNKVEFLYANGIPSGNPNLDTDGVTLLGKASTQSRSERLEGELLALVREAAQPLVQSTLQRLQEKEEKKYLKILGC